MRVHCRSCYAKLTKDVCVVCYTSQTKAENMRPRERVDLLEDMLSRKLITDRFAFECLDDDALAIVTDNYRTTQAKRGR